MLDVLGRKCPIFCLFMLFGVVIVAVAALPTSLLEDAAKTAANNNGAGGDGVRIDVKAKRGHEEEISSSSSSSASQPIPFYGSRPTAIKRTNLNQMNDYPFNADNDMRYQQLENAVLKAQLYNNGGKYYYDEMKEAEEEAMEAEEERRRRRRKRNSGQSQSQRWGGANRLKRQVDLTPEDILTLLSLWEAERQQQRPILPYYSSASYRPYRYNDEDEDVVLDREDNQLAAVGGVGGLDAVGVGGGGTDEDDEEEQWLDGPVYPGAARSSAPSSPSISSSYHHHSISQQPSTGEYYYPNGNDETSSLIPNKHGIKRKRFMVSRKRSEPRFSPYAFNGGGQRATPLYRRLVL